MLMTLIKKSFENIVGKGENASNFSKTWISIRSTFILSVAKEFQDGRVQFFSLSNQILDQFKMKAITARKLNVNKN